MTPSESAASDPDKEAAEFYADPANLRPAGPGRKRRPARLTSHVPVRFDRDVIEALKQSTYNSDGWITCEAERAAVVVIEGLRERGFVVTNEPRCECGWTGHPYNHNHDARMGRADHAE